MSEENLEVGYCEGGLIKQMYWAMKTVFMTWLYCKKNNLQFNKWYGVYFKESEIKFAVTGCLGGSEYRARKIAQLFNSNICGQGYICKGGQTCLSDHK